VHDEDFFWEGVNNNQLLFQQCSECNTLRQPPGPMCPQCQSLSWQPHAAKGTGTVYAWIVSKHPNQHTDEHRIVALIELSEPRNMQQPYHGKLARPTSHDETGKNTLSS